MTTKHLLRDRSQLHSCKIRAEWPVRRAYVGAPVPGAGPSSRKHERNSLRSACCGAWVRGCW